MKRKYTEQHTFECGCGRILITDIFEGRVLTSGIGKYSDQIQKRVDEFLRDVPELPRKDHIRIRNFTGRLEMEQFFLRRSGSTYEELLQRSRFVTEYVGSYPDWVERAIREPANKMGISLVQFCHLYRDFMCMCLRDGEDYKTLFELMLKRLGGVSVAESVAYPTRVVADQFAYGLVSLDLIDFDLASYTKECGLDLDEELSRERPQFSEKPAFLSLIRPARRKVESYLSLDEMHLTMVVPEVSDLSVSELVLKCTYELLSLMEYGDNYIDSTRKKDRMVRAVAAMQTLAELKKQLSN